MVKQQTKKITMTTEEKAKAYDKVSKEVKDFFEGKQKMYNDVIQTLEYLFPELKESEDERIRNDIKRAISVALDYSFFDKETADNCLAWLEKQGNQREQLINKACDLLVDCIEDFMFRRMEIWGEESKKKTLENLRKAMKGE
jgi:hypothetical protein